ncbi:hypothetical protein YERSI8AC_100038 [Enterobacterales bacterium 8AC]|nr:hypothetical protein YERSI8AC_100038 [Enterobacterales bacterium 8AC]
MYTNVKNRTIVLSKTPATHLGWQDVGYTGESGVTHWALRENDVIENRQLAVSTSWQAVRTDLQKSPDDLDLLYVGCGWHFCRQIPSVYTTA